MTDTKTLQERIDGAILTKLRTGDAPGYMRQWHTRTGNVKTQYDETEILAQLTGTSWDEGDIAILGHRPDTVHAFVEAMLGTCIGDNLSVMVNDATYFVDHGDALASHFYILENDAGYLAMLSEETDGVRVWLMAGAEKACRLVDTRPTIAKRERAWAA